MHKYLHIHIYLVDNLCITHLMHTATHHSSPPPTARHRNTPQHTTTHRNIRNIPQHTATQRNTLQHIGDAALIDQLCIRAHSLANSLFVL